MAKKPLSESQEDYLKQIFLLEEDGAVVGTQVLANRLGVAPASVTTMIQKLGTLGLVDYTQYHGVKLTEKGRLIALEIVRHHRLLESFLQKALGYGWEEVHEEAEKLEHYISERFEERIAAWLGHPVVDPHGDPIPTADLEWPDAEPRTTLAQLAPPFRGPILRVATQDSDELNLLLQLGLVPGQEVQLIETTAGGFRLRVGDHQFLLPGALAAKLVFSSVSPEEKGASS